jgi:hypothetical protein
MSPNPQNAGFRTVIFCQKKEYAKLAIPLTVSKGQARNDKSASRPFVIRNP